jgi:sugar phosphate isomerase/epimerase
VAHLKQAADAAERKGMMLLLENEPSCNGGNAEEVGRLVERVASPALKVLWDPGNEAYAGCKAFPDGYVKVKHVLAHVHLKDAKVVEGKAQCVPIGQGSVDFVAQLQALAADGYEGLFTIETHYVPEGGTKADGSELTLAGLRKVSLSSGSIPDDPARNIRD